MSKQSFTTGQVLTAAQVNSLQANDFNQTVSVKTANYTLAAADKGTRIEFNTSGSVTCTVNSGLFDAGDTLVIQNRGAGTATVTAGTATVNTSASLAISQYGQGVLYFVDNTSAIFFAGAPGDITGVTTGATSGLTGGVTSGTADLKINFASKGQLVVGTGSGTADFLTVGTNGHTLVADSSVSPTGLKWAAPAGGGKVLQVVSATYSTQTQNFTQTMADTGLTASITPSSSSSKVLVLVSQNFWVAKSNATQIGVFARLMRGATEIQAKWPINLETPGASSNPLVIETEMGLSYLDSPATTSSTTYKTQFKLAYADAGGWGASANYQTTSSIILMEIGA